jgi:hypothetical protein
MKLGGVVFALTRIIPRREWERYLDSDALPFDQQAAYDYWDDWHRHKRGVALTAIAIRGTEVNRQEFLAAVARVLPGMAKSELFDQADKLAIQSGCLITYNDEVSIRHRFPAVAGIEGAIDGVLLYKLLKRMAAQTVKLAVSETEFQLLSPTGHMQTSLQMSPVLLPLHEIEVGDRRFRLPKRFTNRLKLVSTVCARDLSRPVLTCVHINDGWIEGSDSYRAARVRGPGLPHMLLPVTAAEVIARYRVVRLVTGSRDEWVHFETADGTTISSRLAHGTTYPDLSNAFELAGRQFTLPPILLDVLDRAQVFAHRQHRLDDELTVELGPGQIVIRAQNDNGQFEETLQWTANREIAASFNIHPDFLKLALQQGSSCRLGSNRIKFFGANSEHVIALR